ncbi:DUF2750 domain-containing protein [Chitinophaga sp. Cy-1792]|uniref:DUF2750 domain-containing protein n=1 Tax=Chitinophaga sp. Cy-1792 TaxID=2608339 RepID=UPI0014230468|nr:DUF2750 domain-containing protein [Chitinophaga sp. Cy-1792]NIG54055.1 DUF2750 domain-containing protein [Chitinophaga sp. Cy-1792]
MKKISQQELENVIKLPPYERYQYTMKWIADGEAVYVLENDDNLALVTVGEEKAIPVWSAAEYASLSNNGDWAAFEVIALSLEEFEEHLIPLIVENKYLVSVFPVDAKAGFIVTLGEFLRDLDEELSNY